MSKVQIQGVVKKVEEEKQLEITLKMKRRDTELLAYFRAAHDREVQKRQCTWDGCTSGPWDTWGEMSAHIRTHLILDSADEKNVRQTLKDAEELVHPSASLSATVKVPEDRREELLEAVKRGVARQLAGGLASGADSNSGESKGLVAADTEA